MGINMPQSVDIKGVGIVNFPDEYTPDQIKTAIETDILPQFNKQPTPAAQPENPPGTMVGRALTKAVTQPFSGVGQTLGQVGQSLSDIGQGIGRGGLQLATGATQLGSDVLQAAGVPIPQKFTQALEQQAANLKPTDQTSVANQIGALVPELALIGTGVGTATKLGQAVGLGAKTAGIAAVPTAGATTGAIAGALQPTAPGESRAANAATYAATGAIAGPAAQGIAKGVQRFLGPKAAQVIVDSEAMKQKAGQLYAEAEQRGGVLLPTFTNKFLNDAAQFSQQTKAGKLTSGQDEISSLLQRWEGLRDQPISLQAAKEMDEGLSDIIEKFYKDGKLTGEGKRILDVQQAFRQSIADVKPSEIAGGKEGFMALRDARKAWQQAMKISDIERILARAEFMDQPATAIRNGFRSILTNPKKVRGYSTEEIKLMRRAAQSSVPLETLRTISSRLLGIGTAVTGNLGAVVSAQVAGQAARGVSEAVRVNRAQKVIQEIAQPGSVALHRPPVKLPVNPAVVTGAALTE